LILLLILTVLSSVFYIEAAAGSIAYGAATVQASSLNVRSEPDTSAAVTATVKNGEIIVVLEKTSSEWFRINYQGAEGYVASMYLENVLTAENFDAAGKVVGDDVLYRSTPATSGSQLGSCDSGTIVKIIGINNGWYKVRFGGTTGYIRSNFITIIADPTAIAVAGAADTAGTKALPLSDEQLSLRQQLINFAMQYVGYSYVYGGSSPSAGFDCSGFVYYVFHQFSYNVTRTATSQYAQDGTGITKSELVPGDLVFFSSNGGYSTTHVGIYIGDNQFVHASTPKVGVVVSRLDSDYYLRVWYGAKRVLP
jgi:cell wall-associated NlpC family hydrolase